MRKPETLTTVGCDLLKAKRKVVFQLDFCKKERHLFLSKFVDPTSSVRELWVKNPSSGGKLGASPCTGGRSLKV